MKKGLIALVLSAFISNVYAVKVDKEDVTERYIPHYNSAGKWIEEYYYCYKDIMPAISGDWNDGYYRIVPSDDSLRKFSLRDRLKEVEKFEYMKKSEALASAIKKDFKALSEKLYVFRAKLIEDGCVVEEECSYNAKTCEIKKPLDEILNNLDKYYTNIK
ncbi:hypothetical protein [Helicobacter bilis]|uniref:Uncharacterized protein n=2 Tax=Helicobacter bilis TaxID=37372 RepID=A0A6D2CDK4_9HELI|nr:hypothetical protein [Helicobacter bilis]EMZ40045.1 hypothetical protein C826_00871 [Helicobacter bilis WiWa]TLE05486.1 hypothetical protein LS77_003180 [Helicobacter bilis]TLE06652.1 hypothetical protein LS76_002520 [Helicobacter bilis]